jgi:universal stress protein family protein
MVETTAPWGHVSGGILEQARSTQVDLIVMPTHGRTGPGRWIHGSVAEAVLHRRRSLSFWCRPSGAMAQRHRPRIGQVRVRTELANPDALIAEVATAEEADLMRIGGWLPRS